MYHQVGRQLYYLNSLCNILNFVFPNLYLKWYITINYKIIRFIIYQLELHINNDNNTNHNNLLTIGILKKMGACWISCKKC